MYVGGDLPSAVERADSDVGSMFSTIGVVVPQRRMANWTASNGLANARLGGNADELRFWIGRRRYHGGLGVADEDRQHAGLDLGRVGAGGWDSRLRRRQSDQGGRLDGRIDGEGGTGFALAGHAVAAVDNDRWLVKLEADEAAGATAGKGKEVFLLRVMSHDCCGLGGQVFELVIVIHVRMSVVFFGRKGRIRVVNRRASEERGRSAKGLGVIVAERRAR